MKNIKDLGKNASVSYRQGVLDIRQAEGFKQYNISVVNHGQL